MDMNIKIERKDWNDSDNFDEDSNLDSTRDVVIEDTISDCDKLCIADISKKSSSGMNITLNEKMISGNLAEISKIELLDKCDNKQTSDTESLSSIETNLTNMQLISSTPQPQSEEEDHFVSYKRLIIPQETKYIELILCCNKDPITSFAQLAQNNDDIFCNVGIREFIIK